MKNILIACAVFTCLSTTAYSKTEKFFTSGKWHNIDIEENLLAIYGSHASSLESHKASKSFALMDISIVDRKHVTQNEKILGYPIWFDKNKSATGVLTHEIIVKLKPLNKLSKIIGGLDHFVESKQTNFSKSTYVLKFKSPLSALVAANTLIESQQVQYAHPNFIIPKDYRSKPSTYYSEQWHLKNTGQKGGTAGADVNIEAAWQISKGSSNTVVAVIDGGFDFDHPDLFDSWHINTEEIPDNGIDDDNNGYIDDSKGWNFFRNNNDPADSGSINHGTAVAGLVAARDNQIGINGSCPNCNMIPITAGWTPEKDAEAFYYALNRGAHVITNSWGYSIGTPAQDVVVDAINSVYEQGRNGLGTIILFAMNNRDIDDCIRTPDRNPDISSLDSVIAVSGSSDQDIKVQYSAWGECMEFLSPTWDYDRPGIVTTDRMGDRGYNNGKRTGELPNPDYTNSFNGTSAATPIAAGIFGLMLSVNPDLTREQALGMVLTTADKINPAAANYNPQTGFSQKYGYGRINAGASVRAAQVLMDYSKASQKAKQRVQ